MCKNLTGNEAGLVAYYRFDETSGISLPDLTGNSHTGTLNNMADNDWVTSFAVIGGQTVQGYDNARGYWNAATETSWNNSSGLWMSGASFAGQSDFIVFAHNGVSGITASDLPVGVKRRLNRSWYLDQNGSVTPDLIFNLEWSEGTGLGQLNPASYVLLNRPGSSGNFSEETTASSRNEWEVTVDYVSPLDGYYYTLGVYNTPTPTPSPAATPTPSPSITPPPSVTPTPSATPTASITPTPTFTPTPSPTPPDLICRWDLDYSTYLGGNDKDQGKGIDLDSDNCAYLTGLTASVNFPTENSYEAAANNIDVFVSKFSSSGTALIYSTYLGGYARDFGIGIEIDSNQCAYITGKTESDDFPTVNPAQAALGGRFDGFLTKVSSTGSSLLYSTYLGGNSFDYGLGIAVAADLSAYLAGYTSSSDFPTVNPYQAGIGGGWDAFAARISSTGSELLYSTYLGGSQHDGALHLAVDGDNYAYISGDTVSPNFPTENPFQASYGGGESDAFISKIATSGSFLLYSTYLGGYGTEHGEALAVDSEGSAYLTGSTESPDFPTVQAYQSSLAGSRDVVAVKLSSSGSSLVYSTYLGGSEWDAAFGIAQLSGEIFVTGESRSSDFPIVHAYQATFAEGTSDAFLFNLSASGDTLKSSTYLGGGSEDLGEAVAARVSDRVYVTGKTTSADFPVSNAYQDAWGGSWDAFVTSLEWICYSTTPSPTATPSPTPTAQDYVSPTITPTPTVTPSGTPTPTLTPPDYNTPTPSPVPHATPRHLVIDFDDYDGDGYTDYALYRPSTGQWFIDGITEGLVWGGSEGDIPASGDYDGDGTADIAYFNRFSGKWYVLRGIGPEVITSGLQWGRWGVWPVPGDYNGNGTTDYAVWDFDSHGVGRWQVLGQDPDPWGVDWGHVGDIPVPGDYDGDGSADFTVWRPSTGKWYVYDELDPYGIQWGWDETVPIPGDFDGDGDTDAAVYWPRPTSSTWFMIRNIGKYNWGWVGNKEDKAAIGNFQSPPLDVEIAVYRAWNRPAGEAAWYIYGGSPVEIKVTGETDDQPAVGQPY